MQMWPYILKPPWINWVMQMNKNSFQYFPLPQLNMFSFWEFSDNMYILNYFQQLILESWFTNLE